MQPATDGGAWQPPYSLIKREVEKEILPFCQEHNIGVIVYSSMNSGLLISAMTPERVKNLPFFHCLFSLRHL
ncbi:MAG TPA: aldo/keto reductase [Ktedonobacteraceae bacterium]|nr:aldo/keto reductase [Ktedonobacteraceae bacterium]